MVGAPILANLALSTVGTASSFDSVAEATQALIEAATDLQIYCRVEDSASTTGDIQSVNTSVSSATGSFAHTASKIERLRSVQYYQDAWWRALARYSSDCKFLSSGSKTLYWNDPWATCHTYGTPIKKMPHPVPPTMRERLAAIIQERHAPAIIIPNGKQPMKPAADLKETCARETLRRILGEDDYRNFVRRGFVSIVAKSGRIYQIFPGHGITNVFEQGKMVERLCVVLRGSFPPTDSLIMRYLMILHDEETFRKHAIKHDLITLERRQPKAVDPRPLIEIYKSLKSRAAA